MALDFNSVKFLFWAKNLGVSFNRTLTLGRQGLACGPGQVWRAARDSNLCDTRAEIDRCFQRTFGQDLYADEFFRFLGAKELISADRSDFEGATLLHDLNQPFPENLHGSRDLVLDGGTLEHIFDFPSALRHCLELVAVGGHFVTFTPTNQWMGHGFYQFSPELFFRVFNRENGFELRKIVLFEFDLISDAPFYEVKDPAVTGQRVQLRSRKPTTLAVLAKRTALVPLFKHPPQQSDYVACWAESDKKTNEATKNPASLLQRLRVAINPYWPYWLRYGKSRLIYRRTEGRASLNNPRQFRRLSRNEILQERAAGPWDSA
jgi:SAM-dependent methyltransferase